jgi:hypothetical protein
MVLGALARRYTTFQPPPNVPSEMTLFFELIQAPAVASITGFTAGRNAVTENEYKVTGVYIMGNGTTGTVTGELGGSLNPLETGGEFEGFLTATMPSGCTALRDFAGVITSQTLQWTGGTVGTTSNPCSPNPLTAFNTISMLKFDTGAPLPTPPSTTSSISTTTTTVACTYSLSPTSDSVPSSGGLRTVAITAPAGCAWSAQSFADWITVQPPYGGSGSATIAYNVAASTTARAGTLLIGGIQFPVAQLAPVTTTTTSIVPLADLVLYAPPGSTSSCRTDLTGRNLLVGVRNQGPGDAAASVTRVAFGAPTIPASIDAATPALVTGDFVDVLFPLPGSCLTSGCSFTITLNITGSAAESVTTNNVGKGGCP